MLSSATCRLVFEPRPPFRSKVHSQLYEFTRVIRGSDRILPAAMSRPSPGDRRFAGASVMATEFAESVGRFRIGSHVYCRLSADRGFAAVQGVCVAFKREEAIVAFPPAAFPSEVPSRLGATLAVPRKVYHAHLRSCPPGGLEPSFQFDAEIPLEDVFEGTVQYQYEPVDEVRSIAHCGSVYNFDPQWRTVRQRSQAPPWEDILAWWGPAPMDPGAGGRQVPEALSAVQMEQLFATLWGPGASPPAAQGPTVSPLLGGAGRVGGIFGICGLAAPDAASDPESESDDSADL